MEHASHRYEVVKKCASQCRQLLQQNLFPLRIISQNLAESLRQIEKTKSDVSSQSTHVTRTIQSFFDDAISLLENEKKNMVEQSVQISRSKLEALEEQSNRVRSAASAAQRVIEYCKHNIEVVSDEDMLRVYHQLKNRVGEECSLRESESEQQPCELPNIALRVQGVSELVEECRKRVKVYTFPSMDPSQPHLTEVGKQTTHYVADFSDVLHTPGPSSLQASLTSIVDGSTTSGEVTQVGRGLYEIRYSPSTRGRHQLRISRDGIHAPGNPFPVFATISPSLLGTPIHVMEGLKHPYSAVFGERNQLYVSESGGHSIQMFWREGDKLQAGEFTSQMPKNLTGLGIDEEEYIYAVNTSTHTLSKLTRDGKVLAEVGGEGSDGEEFNHPSGVAVIGDKVYVCDRNNDRIQVYSRDLELVNTIGSQGLENGQMNWPYDLTEDGRECIFVADCDNHRVQVFDREGQFLRTFGSHGFDAGKLQRPTGICLGRDSLLYVTEYANHRVSVFSTDGVYVGSFGSYGNRKGELCYPVGVAVDLDGFVYICDQGNNRIQVF